MSEKIMISKKEENTYILTPKKYVIRFKGRAIIVMPEQKIVMVEDNKKISDSECINKVVRLFTYIISLENKPSEEEKELLIRKAEEIEKACMISGLAEKVETFIDSAFS